MIRSSLRRRLFASTAVAALAWAPAPLLAQTLPDPTDGNVLGGALGGASIGRGIDAGTGKDTLTVTVDGNRPVIEWTRFGVGSDQAARFVDARGAVATALERSTAVLNRVIGDDNGVTARSDILGELTSSPTLAVYLTNPQGILFGPNANVTVGSLVATTLAIDPDAFRTAVGTLRLNDGAARPDANGDSPIAVEVQSGARLSTLGSGAGGRIALIGAKVLSAGTLDARNIDPAAPNGAPAPVPGTVALVAAADVRVSFDPESPLTLTVTEGSPLNNLMTVSGTLKGGSVLFAAATERTVRDVVLGINADVEATTAVDNGSGVLLIADRTDRADLPVRMDLAPPGTPPGPAPIVATLGGSLKATGEAGAVGLYAGSMVALAGAGVAVDAATSATIGGADAVEIASVTAGDGASLNAGGAIRADSVQAGGSAALNAGGALTGLAVNAADERLAATLTSTGADVTATAGGLALFGNVTAATNLRLQGTSVTAGALSVTDAAFAGAADRVRAVATQTDLRLGTVSMVDTAIGGAELIGREAVRLADVTAGSVQAVAGHALSAGTLTARTGDVTVQATGQFAPGGVAGGLTATRLSAESGRVIATTVAGGTLDVTSLTAATEATLTSDTSLTLRQDATVSNGALTLTGTGVTLGDGNARVLSASGRVAVTATASALTGGTGVRLRSSATGEAVLLRARDGIDFAGRAEAVAGDLATGRTGDVILQPGAAATLRLAGGASGRSLLLRNADGTATGQLRTGDNVALGSVDVDRDLVIDSSATVRLADVTVRRGELTLSGTSVNATGALAATRVTATGDSLALAGVDATAGAATLEAGFGLSAGSVAGTGVTVTGGRDVTLASVDARSSLATIEAGRGIEVTTGAVRGTGVVARAGETGLRLNAVDAGTGTLTLSSTSAEVRTGRLDGADTAVTAATGLTTGIVASTGTVDLLSTGGSVTAGGRVTAATGLRVRAASDVELTGGGATTAGDLELTAGRTAGLAANVRAGGALAATAGRAILTGADGISVGAVNAGGNTVLTASQGLVTSGALGGATVSAVGRTGVTAGAVTASADASLTSAAGQVTAGNVQAATGVLLDGRTGVTAGDVAGGTGSATLRSAGGGVTAGRVSGLGVEVTALTDIGIGTALGGAAGGAGSVRLVADQGSLTVVGATSGRGVTAEARTGTTMGDVAAGTGDARLSSGAALEVGDVSGALVRLNGVGRVDAGLLSGNQVDVISAAGIVLGGAETSGGDILLDAEDGVTVSGLLRSGRDVLATGGGALSLGEVRGRDVTLRSRDAGIAAGDITAQRLIDAEANTGSGFGALTAETILLRTRSEGITAGDVAAVRDLQLATIGNLSLGNVGVSDGAAQLESRDGRVTAGAIMTARDIRVEAQTGIAIGDARAGAPGDPADLLLAVRGGSLSAGNLTGQTVTLTQGGTGTLSLGRATAVGALTVRAAGDLLADRLEGATIDASSDGRVGGRTRDGLSAAGGTLLLAADGTALLDAVTLTGVGNINAGALDLRGDVATGGDLTILARGGATLGATDGTARTVASNERLTLTAGTGAVTGRSGVTLRSDALGRGGTRDLTLTGGNGIAFAADTLVAGGTDRQSAVRLGAGAGTAIALDAVAGRSLRAADGSATLTHDGAIRVTRLSVRDPLLLRAEGAGGTIALDRAEVTGGGATLFATGDVTLGRLDTGGATDATSVRGDVAGGTLVSGGSLVLRADATSGTGGAIGLGSATVAGDATLTARTIAAETLVATGSLTADTRRTLATSADQSIALTNIRAGGDATIRSAGALLTDRLAAGGTLDLAAAGAIGGRNTPRATLTADGGAIRAVAGGDMRLDQAAAATDLSLGAAGLDANTLVSGGNAALTVSGAMTLGSVSAGGSATLDGGSIAVDRAEATSGDLSLTARLGAVRAALARARQALTVTASGDAILGQAEAGGALRIGAGSVLEADDLAGASVVATANDATLRRVAAGSGGIDIGTTRALQLDAAMSDGTARLVAGTDAAIDALVARGDVLVEAGGTLGVGGLSGEAVRLAGGTVTAGTVEARAALTADARTGDLDLVAGSGTDILLSAAREATLGQVTAAGLLRATAGERLNAAELRGTTLSLAAQNAELTTLTAGGGGLEVQAGEELRVGQATSAGTALLQAGTDATLGLVAADGDVAVRAGDALTIGTLSGQSVELDAGTMQADSLTARGLLAATTRTGDLGVTAADGADIRFAAAGNSTLGRASAAGLLQVEAAGQLNAETLRGTTVALTARNAELRQVDAGTGGLSATAVESLRVDQATSGAAAALEAGTDATFGTLTAAGDVAAQVGNLLTIGTLVGEGVVLDAGTIQADSLTAQGALAATTRTGDLGLSTADASEIGFSAAGSAVLGQATAAGLLQIAAGSRLNGAELRGTTVALTAGSADLGQVIAGTGGLSVTVQDALGADQVTSDGTVRMDAGAGTTLGTLSAAGDVTVRTGGLLTIGTLSGEDVVLDAGAMQATGLAARRTLAAGTRTGDLDVATADASELRFSSAGNATLNRATATGLLQVEAGARLNADELSGTSVVLAARTAELRQVGAGTGGLSVVAQEALRMNQATSGGGARLEAGTDATLGSLAAAGDVAAQVGSLLTVATLTGERVELNAGSLQAGSLSARGPLTATARAGNLNLTTADASEIGFTAAGDETLGQASAAGLLQVEAGGRLNGAELRGTRVALAALNTELGQVDAGAGGLSVVARDALRLDRATSGGTARLEAGTDAALGTLAAAGDVVARAGNLLTIGTLSGQGVDLAAGVVRADSITARGPLSVTSRTGDLEVAAAEGGDLRFAATRNVTLGRIAATGLLQANAGERLRAADLSGTTIALTARNGEVALATAGSGGLEAVTVEALRLDRATSGGPVRVTAGTDATLGTLAAAGDVAVGAGGLLSVGTLSGRAIELTGGGVTAGTVTARDALTATARTGGLDLTGATGTDIRLTAATDSILGTVAASGRLDAEAGGRLTGIELRAGTLAIGARDVSVERAFARAGGLSMAATQRLALTGGESGGTARLVAGTAATLGTLTAAGDVVVEAGGVLDARTLSGAAVNLTGATVTGDTITVRGALSATARTGDLSIATATGAEARFSSAGDLSLGTASATGSLRAEAGGRLVATDLNGGTVTLRGRNAAITEVVAGAGGLEARAVEGVRIDRATSGGAAVLAAGTEAALGVVSAAGNLSADAGGRLTLADGTGSGVTLTGGSVQADKVAAIGALTAVSREGDLALTTADAGSMRLTAARNAVLGSLRATDALQAGAGERLGAMELRGGTVSLTARTIAAERVTAGGGGLEAVAGQALSLGQAGSAAGARLSAGTDLTLGTLAATGNVSAEAVGAIRAQSVSGADVTLTGATIAADRVVAQAGLTATARGGELRIGDTQAGSAALDAAGDLTLGTVTAARGVAARAAGLLGLTSLTAAEAGLTGGAISVEQATVAGSLKARAGSGGLRLVRAELGRADLGSQGGATLTSLAAREDVAVDAAGAVDAGTVSGANVTLLGGSVAAGSLRAADLLTATARGGNLRTDRIEAARAQLTASGDATLGAVVATGDVAASAGGTLAIETLMAANAGLAGGRVTATGAVVRGALEAAARTGGLSVGKLEGGSARLTSGGDATLGQGTLTGTLVADAAGTLAVGAASAASATLASGSAGLGTLTIAGALTVTARAGDLRLDRGTAGTVDLAATGNATLGTVTAGGRTALRAGGAIGADRIEGGDVTLGAGSATLGSVAARGALGLTTTGRLAWTDASAGGAATVSAGEIAGTGLAAGGAGDLRAQGGLTLGTLRAIGLSVRGGSVSVGTATATAGDLLVVSNGALGLATGTATGTVDLTAASDLRVGSAAAGGRLTLGSGGALAVETLRAGGDASLTATGATSVAGAATVSGAYRLRGASVTLGTAGAIQRQSAREIAVEANAASLLGATTLAASGTVAVTATGRAGTIAFAPESSVEATTVQLSAANRADLGAVTSTGALTVSAADLGLARTLRGASVRLTNNGARGGTRLGGAPTANAAEFQAAGTGFDLDGAEMGLVQTPDLAIAGGARDMVVGQLSIGDGTGAQRLSLLTTGRVDVLGRLSVAGVGAAGARQVTLGGNGATDATAARSSVVRVAATQDGGGRLLMGTTALTINGDRIGIGLDRDFLDTIGYRGAGLSVEQVTRDYVARPTSTLYNAGALGAVPYSDGILLQAHSLSLGYGRYALIQNTAPAGEQRGAVLGVLGQTPAVPTLSLRVNDANNTFALFGTIDGISSSAAALLGGDRISVGAGVSPLGSRVNGCVIGSGGGCLTASIAQPTINLFNTSRAEVVRSADDLSLPFDPLVGTNNESLYLDPAQEAAQSSQIDCNKDDAQCRPAS